MKKITLSTQLFGLFGLVVIGIVVWQVILAGRLLNDIQVLKEPYSESMLQTMLEQQLKTYRNISVGPFSQITVENGIIVHIVKSDSYGVYTSTYDQTCFEIGKEADQLRIVKKKNKNRDDRQNSDTPIFILAPVELEVCFIGAQPL